MYKDHVFVSQFLITPRPGPSPGTGRREAPLAPAAEPRPWCQSPGAGAWRRAATKVVFDFFTFKIKIVQPRKLLDTRKARQRIWVRKLRLVMSNIWKMREAVHRSRILMLSLMISQKEENHHSLNTFQVYWKVFYRLKKSEDFLHTTMICINPRESVSIFKLSHQLINLIQLIWLNEPEW